MTSQDYVIILLPVGLNCHKGYYSRWSSVVSHRCCSPVRSLQGKTLENLAQHNLDLDRI